MYAEELGIGDFLKEPHVAVVHALLLDFQPPLLDILPLYIVLLASFPIVLLGLEACVGSAGAWSRSLSMLLTLRRGWAFHTYPDNQSWFFNPLAWQLLFVIGATCAPCARRHRARPAAATG